MRTRTMVILVIVGLLAAVVAFGAAVLFTKDGRVLYLMIFKPGDPMLKPDGMYIDKVEQWDEVKQFHSMYLGGVPELVRTDPYFVVYTVQKNETAMIAIDSWIELATIAATIGPRDLIVQNVTFVRMETIDMVWGISD